ncbi:MAG: bifunctional alpha/beta hydrolase/class I SAM-dependent methyltransferase [Holophagaceae bacterium]|nr:bifunctional alpha/beta hydrolase/class I SAM-dependent methyltransferase [Holophagaceae bacterium]
MRNLEEKSFQTHDGTSLFYRHAPAAKNPPEGAIVLFHRGHEHSARMIHLVDELDLPDYAFFAWDARGNGRSPGERGFSPSIGTSVRDVQAFIDHICQDYGFTPAQIAVVAQSVGAVLVATWLHDYAPGIRCAVLASPAFRVKLYVPFARTFLRLRMALSGNFFVNSYVKAKFLTHDPERIASYQTDPLITRPISVNLLLGLDDAAERVVADAQAITTPLQMLISGADWVVRHGPQHAFFSRLSASRKEKHVFEGFFHDTLGEKDRAQAVSKARTFLLAGFAEPFSRADLRNSHKEGWSKREADALAKPLLPVSPRGLYWAATRFGLWVGGFISAGIRLGHATGFDSGSTLDYVYRNRPEGFTPIGRMVDWFYLNSIGWRGIRQRKVHLEALLQDAFGRLHTAGQPVHVLDVAAGHGRYVLEAIESQAQRPESVLLRDFSDINVRQGSELIRAKGMAEFARFEKGDAFNGDGLASVEPKPTVAVVSGLYELFPDNDKLVASLEGLARAVPVGGYLVYTNQPWHPQLEMIARALTSHREGAAWVMRRRSQGEMDQLVEAAGFRKLRQLIDEWGIFTVSLAQREA